MISNYEIINPEFARVKVYVCYAGRNRNRSSIDEQTLNKMAKTIYGTISTNLYFPTIWLKT